MKFKPLLHNFRLKFGETFGNENGWSLTAEREILEKSQRKTRPDDDDWLTNAPPCCPRPSLSPTCVTLAHAHRFINGAFALFFGANVIYFLFGRRPLSALGIVHMFQREALVRQWNGDFPAIHTEGGLPGSERAGIVAFIRERLVDLGERPINSECDDDDSDIEAQSLDNCAAHAQELERGEYVTEFAQKHPGYRLDEIALTDTDLGFGARFGSE
ncbi:hypothetical protein K438DRAFT_1782944 [Mycena galopus ATCC 62051]|nr:hypothetical protein K438DRAFT_1782944 [Mycena galopus ATCC 62051]